METAILERLGLTKSEIKVYLALLDLGDATVTPITRRAGVASSKTYELLDKLQAKGLAATHLERGRRHYRPGNPQQLERYLRERQDELERVRRSMGGVLSSLQQRYQEHSGEGSVEVFKGYRGAETVFREMVEALKKGEEFLVMGGGDTPTANPRTKMFFERIHRRRSEKGIVLRIILSEARRESLRKLTIFPQTKVKYLPFGTPSTINIYADTTILLAMSPEPAAIRIRNKQITRSYRQYFEHMWRLAKR